MVRRATLLLVILLFPTQAWAAGYVVQRGDTLAAVASRNHVSMMTLARANHISNINLIRIGQVLVIPGQSSGTASGTSLYHVRWGDTLTGIGVRFGTTVSALRALNPKLGSYLIAGQWLRVCGDCLAAAAGTPAASPRGGMIYVVQPGDSLSTIASRYGLSVSALAFSNAITNPDKVLIGAHISIPAGSATTSGYDPRTARSLIASWSDYYGISRAVTYALAWQESGFNQTMVSSTGALGVMQVEPFTGQAIDRILGLNLNLYDVHDNVHAGTFWLAHLIGYYGGNLRLALAAYYQGTRSIARGGLFAETVLYVNNVMALMPRFGG